jgi:hypothetical protein
VRDCGRQETSGYDNQLDPDQRAILVRGYDKLTEHEAEYSEAERKRSVSDICSGARVEPEYRNGALE